MQNLNKGLLIALALLVSVSVFGQDDRYLDEVFSDVKVTTDVKYGENSTILFVPIVGEPIRQDLIMDVYEPMDDDATNRALVVLLHTGNFLPRITNGGIQGTRQDSSAVEIATRLAKMGYVVASADYRLGWNPGLPSPPLRTLGLIQAAYRGMQDGRTCIRYFKSNDDYNIDPDRIAVWGNGTGGYIALAMSTLDSYNEILTADMPTGKFLFDPTNMGNPATTPMVIEAVHGDIEAKNTVVSAIDFAPYEIGDTSCYANHPDVSSDFQMAFTVGGALGDLSWLDENSVAIVNAQHYLDPFAPYESDVLRVPGTNDLIVEVQGSKLIAEKQNTLGNNQAFIDANIDDIWTSTAMDNAATAGHGYLEAQYPVVNPANPLGMVEGVVIDWWDPTSVPPEPQNPDMLPWDELPNLLADPGGSVTFHQSGLASNFGMSAEKARTQIDTLIGYFAPRAYAQLNLSTVGTTDIDEQVVGLTANPNPANDYIQISAEQTINKIFVYDMSGKAVRIVTNVNSSNFDLQRSRIGSGMFIAQVYFDEGVVTKKVIFN